MSRIIKPGEPAFNGEQQAVDQRPIVAISMPCGDMVHHDTMQSLIGLLFMSQQFARPLFNTYQSASISLSRNMLVRMALEQQADFVLFVDSDMTFPFETLGHLLRSGRSIIGATYPRRRAPFDALGRLKHPTMDLTKCGNVVEAAFVPAGLMLIRTSVFRQIPEPWFEETWDMTQDPPQTSEDYGFCKKAVAAGISPWIHLQLSEHVGHLGVQGVKLPPILREGAHVMREAGHA